jgi:hypothetical protein
VIEAIGFKLVTVVISAKVTALAQEREDWETVKSNFFIPVDRFLPAAVLEQGFFLEIDLPASLTRPAARPGAVVGYSPDRRDSSRGFCRSFF